MDELQEEPDQAFRFCRNLFRHYRRKYGMSMRNEDIQVCATIVRYMFPDLDLK